MVGKMKNFAIFFLFVISLFIHPACLKSEQNGIIGCFYFQTHQIDATELNITYARAVIPWGAVQPEEDYFNWNAKPLRKIDYILKKGIKVIPVVRSVGAEWALKYPGRKSSSPPKDLTDSFDEKYGYSRTYYNFVHEVTKRYKGKFPIVVVENEVTARCFWLGTMEEYLKLVITAKKALKDVDSQIKVADSGVASLCWGILMIDEMVKKGKEKEAFNFYKSYFSQAYGKKIHSVKELKYFLKSKTAREHIKKLEYLLPRLRNTVDILNFHYYENSSLFPQLISFIRKKMGNIPLMNNELGVRIKSGVHERRKKASEELIKKLVFSIAFDLKAVMVFPFTNEEHNIIGLGDEKKMAIDEMMNSFKISLKFLNHKLISYENLSENNLQNHLFRFKSQIVRVLWGEEGNTEEVKIPENYRAYDYQGKEIKESYVVISSSPIFMVKTMN
ncbi:hypothetical protein J7K43_07915 [Candidatus Calescamantes bacterium]|nr:hypothetical protein [Candidatus Calescamantes bacterium]